MDTRKSENNSACIVAYLFKIYKKIVHKMEDVRNIYELSAPWTTSVASFSLILRSDVGVKKALTTYGLTTSWISSSALYKMQIRAGLRLWYEQMSASKPRNHQGIFQQRQV